MNPVLAISLGIVLLLGIVLFFRSRVASEWDISSEDIPKVISKLKAASPSPAWAQILAVTSLDESNSGVALDYLVANGQLEFNWCLLGQKNIEDKLVLIDFFNQNGFSNAEIVAKNGCPLIQVTGANIEGLANRILTEIYHVKGPLTLIGEGFEWP